MRQRESLVDPKQPFVSRQVVFACLSHGPNRVPQISLDRLLIPERQTCGES